MVIWNINQLSPVERQRSFEEQNNKKKEEAETGEFYFCDDNNAP